MGVSMVVKLTTSSRAEMDPGQRSFWQVGAAAFFSRYWWAREELLQVIYFTDAVGWLLAFSLLIIGGGGT